MADKKFLKIKCFYIGLLILSLIASILIPVLPSVEPNMINSGIAEPIDDN